MMSGKTPETRRAANKRQDNKLKNCCIWLVIYLNCTMMHGLTNLKLTVYIMLPVLYAMQKSSLEQLRPADDLLLMTVWQVMTILQNTAPDPGRTVRPSSRAPKLRARQHYNKHIWLHVTVNLQNTNNKYIISWYFVDRASQYNLFFISNLIHCFFVYVQYMLSSFLYMFQASQAHHQEV